MQYIEPSTTEREDILKSSNTSESLCNNKQRKDITNISDTTWWRLDKENKTPPKIKLSSHRCVWRMSSLLWFIDSLEKNQSREK